MSSKRIGVAILHTWYHFLHSMETWVDMFWNSVLQVIMFAFIAKGVFEQGNSALGYSMLLGVVYWNLIWGAQYGVTVGFLWEIWSRSLSTLFITPLTFGEFLVGQMISSIIKSFISFFVTLLAAWFIYHISLVSFGAIGIVYCIELLVFGWGIGMAVLSLIFHFGKQVQALSWALVFLVQPFGGVFYPTSLLPMQIQWIPTLFPSSYIFEAMRQQTSVGIIRWDLIGFGALSSVVWFAVGYGILWWSYSAARRSGAFARMEG